MSVWDRATFEEKYAALVVVFGVLWLAYQQQRRDVQDAQRRRQRDSLTLREEALQRLERGETVELPRWHGEPLPLRAVEDDEGTDGEDSNE